MNMNNISYDILFNVFLYLTPKEMYYCMLTNRWLNYIANDNNLWKMMWENSISIHKYRKSAIISKHCEYSYDNFKGKFKSILWSDSKDCVRLKYTMLIIENQSKFPRGCCYGPMPIRSLQIVQGNFLSIPHDIRSMVSLRKLQITLTTDNPAKGNRISYPINRNRMYE